MTADVGRDATRRTAGATDYAGPADGSSTWGTGRGEPAGLPAAAQPVTERVGWLTAGRAAESGGVVGP